MVVHPLTTETKELFLAYCRKHRYVHDESFLYEDDLNGFAIGESNPTWLLFAEEAPDAAVVGVLSLIADEYYLRGRRLRARIFHCEDTSDSAYGALLAAALPVGRDVDRIEMFLPDTLTRTRAVLEELGFAYYRTSFVMTRQDKPAVQARFPEGFSLRPAVSGKDEETYASIRNSAFANLKGSETPITATDVTEQTADWSEQWSCRLHVGCERGERSGPWSLSRERLPG